MKKYVVTFNPGEIKVEVQAGKTVLDAAREVGVEIVNACGGRGTCNKCMVQIEGELVKACDYAVVEDVVVFTTKALDGSQILICTDAHGIKTEGGDFGIAIDIGTTTVVAELVDLASGRPIAAAGVHNPQAVYGADVISRIAFSTDEENGLETLHNVIIDCANELIERICEKEKITIEQIKSIAVAGNTTMQHLFLGESIESLGQSPFEPLVKNAITVKASKLGIDVDAGVEVYVNSPIAGHVGGDTLAVALVTELAEKKEKALAIDIGTNGEILLCDGKEIYACSTAAGPALEGAKITFGSSGCIGAIEKVKFDPDVITEVIGGVKAMSICGSGLIDLMACLLDAGIVQETGKMARVENWPEYLQKRASEYQGQKCFVVDGDIVFTQKDIREAQLAIAAIKAGGLTLCKRAGITIEDLDRVYVAGAFGNFIHPDSAKRTGLLPEIALDKIEFIGNGSLAGANAVLVSGDAKDKAEGLAQTIKYVELATDMEFMNAYSEGMFFPMA